MIWDDSLTDICLDELLELLSKTTKQLLESEINKDQSMAALYQNTLEQVQKAILSKRSENPARDS